MFRIRTLISFSLFMLMLVFVSVAGVSYAHDLVWPGVKLKALFPQAESFEQKNLYLSDEQQTSIEKGLGEKLRAWDLRPSVYLAVVRNSPSSPPRKAAAIIFIDAYGEGGKIEMGVVVNGKGELMKVKIFENSEYASVTQDAFLKQFEGKKPSDQFKVGSDIIAPQGAVKSAQAIASGAKRGLLIINEVFRKK